MYEDLLKSPKSVPTRQLEEFMKVGKGMRLTGFGTLKLHLSEFNFSPENVFLGRIDQLLNASICHQPCLGYGKHAWVQNSACKLKRVNKSGNINKMSEVLMTEENPSGLLTVS